jgi:hypothetical protein
LPLHIGQRDAGQGPEQISLRRYGAINRLHSHLEVFMFAPRGAGGVTLSKHFEHLWGM